MNRVLRALLALSIALVVFGTASAPAGDVNGCGDGSCEPGFFGESDQTCPLDCGCASARCGEQPLPSPDTPGVRVASAVRVLVRRGLQATAQLLRRFVLVVRQRRHRRSAARAAVPGVVTTSDRASVARSASKGGKNAIRRISGIIAVAALAALPSSAESQSCHSQGWPVTVPDAEDERVVSITIGDFGAKVLLPPGYDDDGNTERYPVLYVLHGGGWSEEQAPNLYLAFTDILDLTATGPGVIVVFPYGGTFGFYSDWEDGSQNWETYHTDREHELPGTPRQGPAGWQDSAAQQAATAAAAHSSGDAVAPAPVQQISLTQMHPLGSPRLGSSEPPEQAPVTSSSRQPLWSPSTSSGGFASSQASPSLAAQQGLRAPSCVARATPNEAISVAARVAAGRRRLGLRIVPPLRRFRYRQCGG
ncbi:MAG: alpha/beta hydrolase-fold protein [Candidatus Binatia bacterium]